MKPSKALDQERVAVRAAAGRFRAAGKDVWRIGRIEPVAGGGEQVRMLGC
jgi:hypothetical protein